MSMTTCLALANDISNDDRDAVLRMLDEYTAAGMKPADAQRLAAGDLVAEIEAEQAEVRRLIREQHPDLFVVAPPEPEPEAPYVSKFFEPLKPQGPMQSRATGPFYSELSRQIEAAKMNAGPAAAWQSTIKGMVNAGKVKADEVEWSGLNEWLGLQTGKVTKQAVSDYLDANGVQVTETVLGDETYSKLDAILAEDGFSAARDEANNFPRYTNAQGEIIAYGDLPKHIKEAIFQQSKEEKLSPPKYDSYQLPGGPLSRDTEILTRDGWLRMDEVRVGDIAMTRRDEDGALEWQEVEAVPTVFADKLYHFKNQSINMRVTACHNMLVKRRRRSSQGLFRAKAAELWGMAECVAPLTGLWAGVGDGILYGYDAGDAAELLGWYIAEGSAVTENGKKSTLAISQSREANPDKCARIEALLGRMAISWNHVASGPAYYLSIKTMDRGLVDVLHAQGNSRDKFVPGFVFDQPTTVLVRLMEGLLLGDGCLACKDSPTRNPRWAYYTNSKQLADDMQLLALLTGQRGTISQRPNGLYEVRLNSKQWASIDDAKRGIVDYNDTAYCVTVKNHAIYVRTDGVAAFTGNSNYREVLLTLPVKQGEPTYFEVHDDAGLLRVFETRGEADNYVQRNAAFRTGLDVRVFGNTNDDKAYQSGHWPGTPNVLAHIRLNDRVDSSGARVLFVEEIQSDFGQKGKKQGFTVKTMAEAGRAAKLAEAKALVATIRKRADADRAAGLDQISDETLALNKADSIRSGELMRELEDDKAAALDNTGRLPSAPFVAKREFAVFKDDAEVTRTDKDGKQQRERYGSMEAAQAAAAKKSGTARDMGYGADTEAWVALSLKRAIKFAVDGGYDKVAFVTGEQSAQRYKEALMKAVDTVVVTKQPDGKYEFTATKDRQEVMSESAVSADRIRELFGKAGDDLVTAADGKPGQEITVKSSDMSVGGEGMRKFYGNAQGKTADGSNQIAIVPAALKDVLRKLGGGAMSTTVIETEGMTSDDTDTTEIDDDGFVLRTQPSFDITDTLRERAANGLPLMSRPTGGYVMPDFGRGSQAIEVIQDRYNRWKQVIDAVRAQGGTNDIASDFHIAEERYHSKVAARVEDFRDEVVDLTKAMAGDGLTMRALHLYAYAKHAPQRNAEIRKKREANPNTGFDSWSGMTDDQAAEILQDAQKAGLTPVYARHHATLMKWTKETRALMLDEGLITNETWLGLEASYDEYVPLRGKPKKPGDTTIDRPQGNGTGKGFSLRKKNPERAKGRYSEADNIIENIILDRLIVLKRGGKNEVLRTLLQFVMDNPDPTLWEVNAVEKKPVFSVDDNGDVIIEEKAQIIKDKRTIGIMDGGVEVSILIKDQQLLDQLQHLNIEGVSFAIGHMLTAQRAVGRLYTNLSPTFMLVNFLRDNQAAAVGMVGSRGFKAAGKSAVMTPAAFKDAIKAEWGTPSADYQLFRTLGKTGGSLGLMSLEGVTRDLASHVKNADRMIINPVRFLPVWLRHIDKVNAVFENATRFAAFQADRAEGRKAIDDLRAAGQTAEADRAEKTLLMRAGSLAKNITVNFDRRGTGTNTLSAWFLFFNPAVQGTARLAESLKSPKVWAVIGSAMSAVAYLAFQNANAGEDDDGVAWWDKIPPEIKDRNLIYILPAIPSLNDLGEPIPGSKTGRYYKIPMAFGYNFFATMANQAVDLWRNKEDPARGVTAGKAAVRLANSAMNAYMPARELTQSLSGSTDMLIMAAIPDFLNAPAQSVINTNSFGRTMYPESDFDKSRPDSQKYFSGQAGTIFQRSAEKLNTYSGGSDYTKGYLDFTPATLENLTRAYGGGPATFILDIANAFYVRQNIERPELDVNRLPFVKQFNGRINDENDRMLAYERMDAIKEAYEPAQNANQDGKKDEARKLAEEAGPLYKLGGGLKGVQKQLTTLRDAELAIIASDKSEAAKYAELMTLAGHRRKVLQSVNRVYDEALRSAVPAKEPATASP